MTLSPNKRPTVIKGHSQSSYLRQNPCFYLTQTRPKLIIICQFISVLWNIEFVCMFMFTKYIIYIKDTVHASLLRSVWFFMTPWTAAHQALLSMEFSRQNTGMGCHFPLQRIFLTQGWSPYFLQLLHCRWILYHWATGKPTMGFCCEKDSNLPFQGFTQWYICIKKNLIQRTSM